MSDVICEGGPRSTISVGLTLLVWLSALLFFAVQSFFDGYWQTGTYGFVVPIIALGTPYLIAKTMRVFWHHSIRGTDWIFVAENRFHLAFEGHETVACDAVAQASIEKVKSLRSLVFRGANGEMVGSMPLTLSAVDPEIVLRRANAALLSR